MEEDASFELTPKSPRTRRAAHALPPPSAFGAGHKGVDLQDPGAPGVAEEQFGLVVPCELPPAPAPMPAPAALGRSERLAIETAPSGGTVTDLLEDHTVLLDPATPRTPKHQLAEHLMTTGAAAKVLRRHMDAVVKVFATHAKPNFELPWQRQSETTSKSTGFAIRSAGGERWVLTNAHSVQYGTQVQLKRRSDDEKYMARVLAVGTECDVALLTVEDDEFWGGIVPLELGGLPALQESVAVLGYPIGGDSLAVSAGVVSRVQLTHYSHGCMSLLAVQTDAAINSGNSGGPVLDSRGRCVGIAFQSLTGDASSIGYVVPVPVVEHFLEDVRRHGHYTGFPSLNIVWQEMDSKALKKAYGMAPRILVRMVVPAADEARVLRTDDVVLALDGVAIGSDGSVPFRQGERVDFKYLVTSKFVGDTATLDVLRAGEQRRVEVRLAPYYYLVPPNLRNAKPSYLLIGGLVFTACSDSYLVQRYGALANAPIRLMAKSYFGFKQHEGEQVVVLSSVLACDATAGYDSTAGIRDAPLLALNGTPVTGLAQLARLARDATGLFLRFDLEAGNKVVVLDRAQAQAATQRIMDDHGIAAPMSGDLLEALAGGAEDRAPASEGQPPGEDGMGRRQEEAPAAVECGA